MDIKRHSVWTAMHGEITLDEFVHQVIPKVIFKKDVNSEIIKAFAVIERLLVHSYFEYEFLDVAYTKALHIFEMALKVRYNEINVREWDKKKPLMQLIAWFENGGYFEISNPAFMDHVRGARNHLTHPTRYGFGGIAGLHWISWIVDLINDLYEDVTLRNERHSKQKDLEIRFRSILNPGAELLLNNLRMIIYDLRVVFIDNKANPNLIYISLIPVFKGIDDSVQPAIIQLLDGHYSITQNQIRFLDEAFPPGLTSIEDNDSKKELMGWLNSWQRTDDNQNLSERGAMMAKQTILLHEIDSVFQRLRQEFHHKDNKHDDKQ